MNIDFLKWKVKYAEGFELQYIDDVLKYIVYTSNNRTHSMFLGDFKDSPSESLLLQRAIEGINIHSKYKIIAEDVTYTVFENNNPQILILAELKNGKRDLDKAKEQALRYIYEELKQYEPTKQL